MNVDIDLGLLTKKAFSALSRSMDILQPKTGLTVDRPFEITPDKGYSAKALVKAEDSGGKSLGSGLITLVMFRPGEGTGNTKDYQIEGVESKYTPRNKEGVAELYIPIGTFFNEQWIPGITCLSCWGLDSRGNILGYKGLTSSATGFEDNLKARKEGKNFPYPFSPHDFTFDRNPTYHAPNKSVPYGDPHAVLWDPLLQIGHQGEFFQIGSFLPFPEETQTLQIIRNKVKG